MAYRPSKSSNLISRALVAVRLKAAGAIIGAGLRMSGWRRGGAYTGAGFDSSLKQWLPWLFSPNEELADLDILATRCLDLYRNEPIAQAIVDNEVDGVIGTGLRMHSTIDWDALGIDEIRANEIEDAVERRWKAYTESHECDAAGQRTFAELQAEAYRSTCNTGGILVTMPYTRRPGSEFEMRIQLIESIRLGVGAPSAPNISYGVEHDTHGYPIAYWISPDYNNAPAVRVEAIGRRTGRVNVIHYFHNDRPGQVRGVPLLKGCIKFIKNLSAYCINELVAARVASLFTAFIKSENPNALDQPASLGRDDGPENTVRDPNDYRMGQGSISLLGPGESVEFADPKRPNNNFGAFVETHLIAISMAIRRPYEIIRMKFDASYSASRAAIGVDHKQNKIKREKFSKGFCQPIYEEWLADEVLAGNIDMPGFFDSPSIRRAWCGTKWEGDRPVSIDETKEVAAAAQRVKELFSTIEEETYNLTGKNYKDNFRQRRRELLIDPTPSEEENALSG